ncbi:MAG: sugar phosphate nucleotidyltransferase [Sphaerochaetaceae bacterium]
MKPTVVVLAAGMGSRYGGVKQIDSVGMHDETLLDFGIYDAKLSGFSKVVFIIRKDIEHDFRERLFDRIARNMDASYVFQSMDSLLDTKQAELSKDRTKPWGTVHALLCSQSEVHTPFVVINSDDYYGRKAFQIIEKHLEKESNEDTEHAMVGYVLENTMSLQGSVSRALCSVRDGYLTRMVENTKIEFVEGKPVSHFEGKDIQLSGKEWVSMNFFGFTVRAYESFKGYWDRFIKDNVSTLKNECLLPNAASEIVTKGAGRIKMYTTDEKWFGMTYSSDREIVRSELKKKILSGYYPERLWEK